MSLEFSADINYMEKTPPDTDCGHLDLKIGFNADWFFSCSQYRKITENKWFFFFKTFLVNGDEFIDIWQVILGSFFNAFTEVAHSSVSENQSSLEY